MSINKPHRPELGSQNFFRQAITTLLAGALSVTPMSCGDTTPYEPPKRMPAHDKKYDHLYDGIEIVPSDTIEEESPLDKTIIPDDPECTANTCKPA